MTQMNTATEKSLIQRTVTSKKYHQRINHNFDNEYIKTLQFQAYIDEQYKKMISIIRSPISAINFFIIGHSLNESDADAIKKTVFQFVAIALFIIIIRKRWANIFAI
ncbi:MAG: hypothetical protein L6V84_05555 [Oscillospiraceae bacterium]|nr:MAG: hypothetical protein L6V84_05555 [Oscillospiraceae bacterium]